MTTRCLPFFTKVKTTPSNYPILYKIFHNWVISSLMEHFLVNAVCVFRKYFFYIRTIAGQKILWKSCDNTIDLRYSVVFTYSKRMSPHNTFQSVFLFIHLPKKFKMMTNFMTSSIFEFHEFLEFRDFIQFLFFSDGSSTMYGKYWNSYEKFRGCI